MVDPKEFVIAALDVNRKTFMICMAFRKQEKMLVHSKRPAQVGALLFNQAFTDILVEYSDYSNVFLAKNVAELPENTEMNKYAIKQKEDW